MMAAIDTQDTPRYLIKREWRSSLRLNMNHLIMKEVLGGLLHPSIPPSESALRIADVGTGTAAWALETAAELPTAQIDGFDISSDQFSPLYGVENVNLIVHDCFEPFPPEHIGQYDIVHSRFWMFVVNDPDAPRLLQNVMTLLKPGGFLQWFEPLPLSVETIKPSPDVDSTFMDYYSQGRKKPRPDSSYAWLERLPDMFRESGLLDVSQSGYCIQPHLRAAWMQSCLAGVEDAIVEDQEEKGKVGAMVAGMHAEMKNGVAIHTPFTCVVGRKA